MRLYGVGRRAVWPRLGQTMPVLRLCVPPGMRKTASQGLQRRESAWWKMLNQHRGSRALGKPKGPTMVAQYRVQDDVGTEDHP